MNTKTNQPSPASFASLFLEHPASVDETYFQHMRFAFGFAFWLVAAGCCAVVHAIVPGLCVTSAREIICRLHARLEKR